MKYDWIRTFCKDDEKCLSRQSKFKSTIFQSFFINFVLMVCQIFWPRFWQNRVECPNWISMIWPRFCNLEADKSGVMKYDWIGTFCKDDEAFKEKSLPRPSTIHNFSVIFHFALMVFSFGVICTYHLCSVGSST